MNDIPQDVIDKYAGLCADLIRLKNESGYRAQEIRKDKEQLQSLYPRLEYMFVDMMQYAILGEE